MHSTSRSGKLEFEIENVIGDGYLLFLKSVTVRSI